MLLIIAVIFLFNVLSYAADENQNEHSSDTDNLKKRVNGPYCGLYCLYTIMKMADKEVGFQEFLKPEYVGSRKGSSFGELQKAAEDYGLYTKVVAKITSKELSCCDYPIIMHVKLSMKSQEYNHYILFLGTKNSHAKIFDPPNPIKLVSYAELAPQWDGNGLIISAEPIDLDAVFAPARNRFIIYASILIAGILALHWAKRFLPVTLFNSRIKMMGLSITQATGFAILALLVGMFYHFADDAGLLANEKATSAIQKAHAANFIPKVTERKVHRLLDGDAILIDARFARDYKSGHIEGAISVPVDANDIELQKATANISKDSRIVMYCQSSTCKYAEIVAIKLIDDGFSNISIFKGGWVEWAAKNGKKEDATS